MRNTLMTCLLLFAAGSMTAATFVVPADRELLRRSDAIVVATAIESHSQHSPLGGVETVTPMTVEEIIKGNVPSSLDVVEPGGELNGVRTVIPGVPRFESGQRMLLLLREVGPDRWAVTELVLGKFHFAKDKSGRELLVRDEAEIVGWDAKGQPFREQHRDAARFLDFVRGEARGGHPAEDYLVPSQPLAPLSSTTTSTSSPSLAVGATASGFSATSYTMAVSGSLGARWSVFPNAVTFFAGASGEPGAPGGGVTAVQTGLGAWTNECGSNVNYVYGGTDSTHTSGLHGPDGANTVLFERDLSSWGVLPFTCSSNGYSGTLGLGGITSASGSHVLNGETFSTTTEGDVEMNKGIANCTLLFNNGDWNSAVTHELGHTLGFRHADQDRNSSGACTASVGECSQNAIMKSFITTGLNAALQQWDIDAVETVYPGGTCGGNCTPPAITAGPNSQTITSGQSATLSVTATGTAPLTYQWYVGTSGNTSQPLTTGNPITVTPSSTTSYWVRVSNSCGAVNSGTATVTVNPAPPPPPPTTKQRVHGDYDGDGRTDPAAYRPSTGQWLIANRAPVDWGSPGDIPAPADYDGDHKTDIAVFRPSTGQWFIITSSNGGTRTVQFGQSGDDPVPDDYDGDGKDDPAVYRRSTGQWFILQSTNGQVRSLTLGGRTGDIPCPADYDGDGKWDPAVEDKNTGQWRIQQSSNGQLRQVQWGGTGGDTPIPADYDGDGKADICMESQLDGKWYIINSHDGSTRISQWGGSGADQPQPGYYDGDNLADLVIFNNGNKTWYIWQSSNGGTQLVTLGQSGDIGVSYY